MHKDNLINMDKENENNIVIFACDMNRRILDGIETNKWENYEVETLMKLNRLIQFASYSSDEEFVKDFEKYFNKDSVLNYYCFMRFAHLIDNISKNMFLVTYDGEIWYLIPYDFDLSWGNMFTKE